MQIKEIVDGIIKMATKEELQSNTLTKEARPQHGTQKGGFDRRAFGIARFGEKGGYELTKEELQTNSQTKEALNSM